MIPNAVSRAFIVPLGAAALMLGLSSDLQAAPAAPRSMSSVMHFDLASDQSGRISTASRTRS